MKLKKGAKFLIAIAILVIVAISICFLYKPVYYRLYLKDRITGDIQISIDGQSVSLDKNNFHIVSFAEEDDDYSIQKNESSAQISIKGGKYGGYTLGVDIPNFPDVINLKVMQFNWWNVTTFNIAIDIDTNANVFSYTYTYTWIEEDGSTRADSGTKTNIIGEDELIVYIGA